MGFYRVLVYCEWSGMRVKHKLIYLKIVVILLFNSNIINSSYMYILSMDKYVNIGRLARRTFAV